MTKKTRNRWLSSLFGCLAITTIHSEARVIFRDEFNGARNSGTAEKWTRETHAQGRGVFGGDAYINGNGRAFIGTGRYHRQHNKFSQTAIQTKRTFKPSPGKQLQFKVRMRIPQDNQVGIVYGFFLYNQYRAGGALRSDELDFEWLTNRTANRSNDKIQLTTWAYWNRENQRYGVDRDGYHGTHLTAEEDLGRDAKDFHTYIMTWRIGRVSWYVRSNTTRRWVHLKSFYGDRVPSGAQNLFLNAWVADSSWAEAYNGDYRPTNNSNNQRWSSMEIDWVRVEEKDS